MKVSVLGAGAIGSMLGGLIRHHDSDVEVLLVVRGEHGRRIGEEGGVTLDGPWGTRFVPVGSTFDVGEIAGSDLVVVTVKSHATEEALAAAAPFLGDATVVSIQNGINHRRLACHVAPEQLVLGMTATNMAVLEPGRVSLQLDGATVVGPPPGAPVAAAVERAAALLRKTGLRIEVHPGVSGVMYNKLAINALGFASCLSRSNFMSEALCHAEWRTSVGRPLVEETIRVYEQANVELARIPGRPDIYGLRRFLRWLDAPVVGPLVGHAARQKYDRKPILFSLQQDLERGRPTEVDFINGELVQLARAHGTDAPYNGLVVELVHELERRGPGAFRARDEVIARFRQLAPQAVLAG